VEVKFFIFLTYLIDGLNMIYYMGRDLLKFCSSLGSKVKVVQFKRAPSRVMREA